MQLLSNLRPDCPSHAPSRKKILLVHVSEISPFHSIQSVFFFGNLPSTREKSPRSRIAIPDSDSYICRMTINSLVYQLTYNIGVGCLRGSIIGPLCQGTEFESSHHLGPTFSPFQSRLLPVPSQATTCVHALDGLIYQDQCISKSRM